jgi:Cysteine-rich CWC
VVYDRAAGRALERSAPPHAQAMVLIAMIAQTCESCGREFGCGAQDETCWCAQAELGPDRLAILREHFERCLCPDCLRVAARAAPPRG